MAVGRRMLALFERRPGLLHATLTGLRPAWNAFADITRGSATLGGMVRSNGMARRALEILDRRMDTSSGVGPAGRGVGQRERSATQDEVAQEPKDATAEAIGPEAPTSPGESGAPGAPGTSENSGTSTAPGASDAPEVV